MKYNYFWVEGYWDNDSDNLFEYKISQDKWNGKFDSDDEQILYFLDEDETIKKGDIIADGFTITKIYGKD